MPSVSHATCSVGDLDEWIVQEYITPCRSPRLQLSVSVVAFQHNENDESTAFSSVFRKCYENTL